MCDIYLSSAEEKAIFFRICPRRACPEFTIVTRVVCGLGPEQQSHSQYQVRVGEESIEPQFMRRWQVGPSLGQTN
jgi:hypothetical protein